jgi:biotin transport system permease protein
MLNSLHVEGRTWLHRLPAAPKLFLLAAVSLVLFFVQSPVVLALMLLLAGGVYTSLGLSAREALKRIRPVLITILLFALINLVLVSPQEALTTTLRLLSVLLLAASVTATTTIAAFMDVLAKLFLPLERLGLLKAADISLAVGLVLRFVPEIAARYESLKEAHRARGLPLRIHRVLGPLIISTLKDADTIAEAIDARGIRGQ